MFKTKTQTEKAVEILREIAKSSAPHLAIINAARAEVEAECGKNRAMNEAELEFQCRESGELNNARQQLIRLRLEAERVAQPIISEVAALEAEVRATHAENIETLRRSVVDGTIATLGEALARKCSYIAPQVIAEQEFQAANHASTWAESMRRLFADASDFDGRNIAEQIALQVPRIQASVLVVRQHSEELRAAHGRPAA
ncbi:hypothetical protein [Opitutus sp. ER46]|uniref:hypothetical protein n=1 Tax=Opitutus sp. ER46 TaxID=2161864 RepID=UPI000D301D3B|nr:hypothetical protein [Opitutus sp. ER46]PTX96569.1 hypothetical protein DB354_07890 [Opitutus sp. ER46]